jgi:hypothetical protein
MIYCLIKSFTSSTFATWYSGFPLVISGLRQAKLQDGGAHNWARETE